MKNFSRRAKRQQTIQDSRAAIMRRRASTLELLEARAMLAADPQAVLHNLINPRDVNNDGIVSPRDALLVINNLIHNGPHKVDTASASPLLSTTSSSDSASRPPLIDVNGDNVISPADALSVI